jgi:outer membrane PBP1 activator LpoA protein
MIDLKPLKQVIKLMTTSGYLLCLVLFISACGSTPTKSPSSVYTVATLEVEISQLEQQNTPKATYRLIEIADKLRLLGSTEKALGVIRRVNSDNLPDDQYIIYVTVASNIFSDDRSIFQSSELLSNERLEKLWDQLTVGQQQQFHRQRAETYSQIGDLKASINERILLDRILVNQWDLIENHESLWLDIVQLSLQTLTSADTTQDPITRGWYELASISKQNESNLEAKRVSINVWVSMNPTHPAAIELPLDLQLLNTLIAERPKKIGLLLPVSGKLALAGKTIRDGFLAAYFNQGSEYRPEIIFYDTTSEPINTIYDQAINDGVELIIGPLQKDKVNELHQRQQRLVTTLALNYVSTPTQQEIDKLVDIQASAGASASPQIITTEDPLSSTSNNTNAPANINVPLASAQVREQSLATIASEQTGSADVALAKTNVDLPFYQFGLSLEDEALQTANRAWLEGNRYAMIIAAKADWSQRAVEAFTNRWQELGGSIIVKRELNTDDSYSTIIKSAFDIDKSESRATGLKRLFGKNFEFEPRRRQDIDMIFLVTRAKEGQQIKPTLSFHYAGDLPVYATSQIYNKSQTIGQNKDLNGIRFITLPWTLYPEEYDKDLINKNINIPANFSRLYAMGIDAYYLHDRLRQLARLPNTSIFGTTGKLRLDSNKRIIRDQPWAEVVGGEARPLPQLTQMDKTFE